MRNTTKHILGVSGLAGVFAMTAYAATVPIPGASAVSSVTDVIQVRVVGSEPEVTVDAGGVSQITEPNFDFSVTYEHVMTIKTTVVAKDANGNIIYEGLLWEKNDADYNPGEQSFNLNLNDLAGIGYYTFTTTGIGYNGVPVEKIITVTYTNVDADVETNEDGNVVVDIEPAEGTDKIEIDVIDKPTGEVVRTIVVDPETGDVTVYENGEVIAVYPGAYKDGKLDIPMDGLGSGDYTIVIRYQDAAGDTIGVPYTTEVKYTAKATPVPDTGAFFQNLNISREDFLITGLLIFFVFGVVAFGIVMRGRNTSSRKNSKKR